MCVSGPWELRLPLGQKGHYGLSGGTQASSFRFSASSISSWLLWGRRKSARQKGGKVPILGHGGLSCLTSPTFSKTLGWNKEEFRVSSCSDGFPETS